jgi:hypothetical protein
MIANSNLLDMSLADALDWLPISTYRGCRPLAKSFDKTNRISKLLGRPSGTTFQCASRWLFSFFCLSYVSGFVPWRRRCHLASWTVSDALCKHVQRHNKVGSSSRPLTKIVLLSAYFFFTPAVYAGTGASVLRRDSMLAPSLSLVYALEAVKAPTMYLSNIVTNRPLFFLIDTPIATH